MAEQAKKFRGNVPPPAVLSSDRVIAKMAMQAAEVRTHSGGDFEVDRIVSLPLIQPLDSEELSEFNRTHVLGSAYDEGWRFWPIQAGAIASWEIYGGLLAPVGVGWGKTLISIVIANDAFVNRGIEKILYLCPPHVMPQFVGTDIKWSRTRVPFNMPLHVLGGRDAKARASLAKSGRRGLYVMPYSLLSTKDTSELLDLVQPGLIIADEAHNLAQRRSARTKRVMRYIEDYKPAFCALSGTITSKTIKDYWHLARAALGNNNPLPNSASMASDWGIAIDAQAIEGTWGGQSTAPLLPLILWARANFPKLEIREDLEGFRLAYKLRLTTAPGVVASGDAEIGTSLTLVTVPVPDYKNAPGYKDLQNLIDKVENEWKTPNDDEIEHAIHTFKWMYELSAGFYNLLFWPEVPALAKRKNISEAQAEEMLKKAMWHHLIAQEYAKELRKWLEENSAPGLDTPMLVGNSMHLYGAREVGNDLFQTWKAREAADFEGRPDRDKKAVRVCDYKIIEGLKWLESDNLPKGEGAIMWVYNQEVGEWAAETYKAAGLDVLHAPAGDAANLAILDPKNAKKIVVASMTAHGTGKNLQHFQNQYFLQWPRSPTMAEQVLGRTHRNGQKADELRVFINNTTLFDQGNFAACVVDALYIHQTTGNRQKLIYAGYDPMPPIFPPSVLRQRGFENRVLTAEQQHMLDDKFGE